MQLSFEPLHDVLLRSKIRLGKCTVQMSALIWRKHLPCSYNLTLYEVHMGVAGEAFAASTLDIDMVVHITFLVLPE